MSDKEKQPFVEPKESPVKEPLVPEPAELPLPERPAPAGPPERKEPTPEVGVPERGTEDIPPPAVIPTKPEDTDESD